MFDNTRPISILLLMTNTISANRFSGIHRVAIELAKNLPALCSVDVVKWDDQDGQLRFADEDDLNKIFNRGSWPPGINLRRTAHMVRYRFGDLLNRKANLWLLNPEIAYHAPSGNENFQRTITQCREYGVNIASIFYDLIPINNKHYTQYSAVHTSYVCEMYRSDAIFPISKYSGLQLKKWFLEAGDGSCGVIQPILLPELQAGVERRYSVELTNTGVVMVGTVEPRKQQVELLKAFISAANKSKKVAGLKLNIAGSLHPDVASEFRRLVSELKNCQYLEYASEEAIEDLYREARFSIFPSNDEGYGLPIAESLARGVPCLCANFGSMGEVAHGGGCLTTDVSSFEALEAAIMRMADDDTLVSELRAQINIRQFRNWEDYSREVVESLTSVSLNQLGQSKVMIVQPGAVEIAKARQFDEWVKADTLVFSKSEDKDKFIGEAGKRGHFALLPPRMKISSNSASGPTATRPHDGHSLQLSRSKRVAQVELGYANLRKHQKSKSELRAAFLKIVISTYNRAPFVRENVRWLLDTVIKDNSEILLVVVDNASTDDTLSQLCEFVGRKNFELVESTANTGMLGNLKTCSTLVGSEYVWVTGDDDFILPGQVKPILEILKSQIGIPLAVLNFGVYHRFAMSSLDTAPSLINEMVALSTNPSPSGLMPLRKAGAQHDNLFTAVYPIIWRSDLLAACFNYPFTGTPFKNLVESVPTTKLLLDTYGSTEVYWHSQMAIAGNAHNSWSKHRPRWHAYLMPTVFELARDAGIDPVLLYEWSRIHKDLYYEAVDIAKRENWAVQLGREDFEVSWRVFREDLSGKVSTLER